MLTVGTWDDLDASVVRVRRAVKRGEGGAALGIGEPKTLGSRRNLALSSRAAPALACRRRDQLERLAAGPAWSTDERWAGLVFTTEVGTPMYPSNVRRSFAAACTRAGIEPLTPYELRHTAASLLSTPAAPPTPWQTSLATPRLGCSTPTTATGLPTSSTPRS